MNKEILRLAIPNILSNISVPLLSTVDTALMGRLSEAHIGAVGVGAMIFNFVYWNFGFLRMGTTGLTAQAFGKKDTPSIINNLGRSGLVALFFAGLIMLLQVPFGEASFYLMNAEGAERPLLEDYFYIRIWAAPATLGLYALLGWFFGMQNAIYPLILTISINVVNIILSYFLVWHLEMEVAGVAWGTVIAQYVGLLLGLLLFYQKYTYLFAHFKKETLLKIGELKQFFLINRDIFLRTVCLTFSFGFFYSQSSTGGEMFLAANVILMQYLHWMSYAVDGFSYAAESLVGKYYGAKQEAQTRKTIRLSLVWGMALALLFSIIYWVGGTELLSIFTDQAEVKVAAESFLIWMVILPILGTPSYIWDGVFIGLTAAKSMRNSMFLALAIFLLSFFLFQPIWGNHGLWLALNIFMFARGGIQWGLFAWKGLNLK